MTAKIILIWLLATIGAFVLTVAAFRWLRRRRQRKLYGSY